MHTKLLGSLLTASLVAFSANTFAQSSAPSGQDTPREASSATPAPLGAPVVIDNASAGASGASIYRCDTLAGDERVRCLQTYDGNRQGGMGIYTQQPGASGPGTTDKHYPGLPEGVAASRDVGTLGSGAP
jgi:hypothetical protein